MAKAQFNREEVLDKAIDLFWQHGYSASSMQQVVKATGLKPGSIYLAFENKEGLFREALERYAQKSIARTRELLKSAPSVLEGICQLFEDNIQQSSREDYCSCFLVKTRLELAAEGDDLHTLASEKLEMMEALFRNVLEKEFPPEISQRRATSIMLHIFGTRVYGYQPQSEERMRQGLREGLPWLPWT
ncbi:TetR/AcrR family transcriptional regulator [Kiritimatiellaeota bacterium B1221]|nr:TetR/AcrR family transcriptional regulator [Kiritimatiellaeota bacterium B1221]